VLRGYALRGDEVRRGSMPPSLPPLVVPIVPNLYILVSFKDLRVLMAEMVAIEVTAIKDTVVDNKKGALPKMLAPRKWSETKVKRPMKKFLEEIDVWFDAMDINGMQRVMPLPTLLESTIFK
jgi:hypothetical protein